LPAAEAVVSFTPYRDDNLPPKKVSPALAD
jgi:hypothetical protein